MSVPRKFDWDEAQRLRRRGAAYTAIAELFGVSPSAVRFACDPRARAQARLRAADYQASGRCVDCGRQCSYNASMMRAGTSKGRCLECAAKARVTSVRDGALRCLTCRRWLPDSAFTWGQFGDHRRGRHTQCSECQVKMRTAYRAEHKVSCEGGCGRMVEGKGRPNTRTGRNGKRVKLDPNRPYFCRPCALRAFHAERAA
jgi:hypothetical protein